MAGSSLPHMEAALETAREFGWPVFPTVGKRPASGFRWRHFASEDPDDINAMPWENADGYGIALPPGIVVVDLDADENGSLDRACRTLAGFPYLQKAVADTLTVRTPRGGIHYYLRNAEGMELPGKLGPKVDLKRYGGYVIGPGSPGYTWVRKDREISNFPFFLAGGSIH